MPTATEYQPKKHTRQGPPPLQDPQNVNSQLGPGDFRIPHYNPDLYPANPGLEKAPGHDLRVIRMLQDRVMSAVNYKRYLEPEWYESLAYFLGKQDLTWNYQARQLVPMRNRTNYHKWFGRRNKIKPKVKKLVYQAFSQKPDASIKASTMSDLDRQAASEGRSIVSHCDYKFHRDQQTRRIGLWALITSTVALGITWNEKAAADMPKFKGGQIVGSEIVDGMGEIEERIYPIFKILFDPQAHDYQSLGWIIDQEVLDLEYIREQWENGQFVAADTGQGVGGYVESRLAAVLGEPVRGSEPGPTIPNTAVIYRCFEPPTDIYPDGRMMICSQKVLLRYEESWPHMDARKLMTMGIRVPYAFMNYEEGQSTIYGSGVVGQLLDPQKAINVCVSREMDHLASSWGKLLVEEGSRIGPTAFDDARANEKVNYARGSTPPQHLKPDFSVMQAAREAKMEAEADLDDMSGLHEVSDAQVPGGVDSGKAIGMLKSSDAVMGSMFAANIEEFHRQRATLEIHVVGMNYTEPRLLYISDGYFGDPGKKMQIPQGQPPPQAPPPDPSMDAPTDPTQAPQMPPQGAPPLPPDVADTDSAMMDVRSFKALQNGGSCHVWVVPGSALAKDPDAQKAEILDLLKLGAFGPPGDPATLAIVLKLLDYASADEIVETARKAYEERVKIELAQAPNPASAATIKAQADIALENMKGQREIGIIHSKQEADQETLQLKAQLDQQKIIQESQAEMLLKQADQIASLHQVLLDKLHPDLKLTGTLTPVETAAALQTMGFPTPDAGDLLQTSQANAQTAQHAATTAAAGAQTAQIGVTQAGAEAQSAQAGVPAAEANAQEAAANADQAQQIAAQPLPPPDGADDDTGD